MMMLYNSQQLLKEQLQVKITKHDFNCSLKYQ